MVVKYSDLKDDFDRVFYDMLFENLEVGTVAFIGERTKPIGDYFANKFKCSQSQVPSIMRKGRNLRLASSLDSVYPYFPEPVLRVLSFGYKKLYSSSKRVIPKIDLTKILEESKLPVLLVDDNCFTGKTMEAWKYQIRDQLKRDVKTFSITVTGDFRPDYFCFEGWHSFEWRLIGI